MLNLILDIKPCIPDYCCAGCQAKSRNWTLVRSCDNQGVVSIADLEVQLLYSRNPPLNARTCTSYTES